MKNPHRRTKKTQQDKVLRDSLKKIIEPFVDKAIDRYMKSEEFKKSVLTGVEESIIIKA
jgi:hypothetical protein